MELNKIYKPVQEDLARVEEILKDISETDSVWLSELLSSSLTSGGKVIRPMLVLLAGKFYDYNIDNLLSMAVAVELYHTATLAYLVS